MSVKQKWKELPTVVKGYFIGLLLLGLIPIGLSVWYPLHSVNQSIDGVVKSVESIPTAVVSKDTPMATPKSLAPPTAPQANNWVQIIGGINSVILSWVIYFDRRRRQSKGFVESDE